jgi:hypothetical protein
MENQRLKEVPGPSSCIPESEPGHQLSSTLSELLPKGKDIAPSQRLGSSKCSKAVLGCQRERATVEPICSVLQAWEEPGLHHTLWPTSCSLLSGRFPALRPSVVFLPPRSAGRGAQATKIASHCVGFGPQQGAWTSILAWSPADGSHSRGTDLTVPQMTPPCGAVLQPAARLSAEQLQSNGVPRSGGPRKPSEQRGSLLRVPSWGPDF